MAELTSSIISTRSVEPPAQLEPLKLERERRVAAGVDGDRREQKLARGVLHLHEFHDLRRRRGGVLREATERRIVVVGSRDAAIFLQSEPPLDGVHRDDAAVGLRLAVIEEETVLRGRPVVQPKQRLDRLDRTVAFRRQIDEQAT